MFKIFLFKIGLFFINNFSLQFSYRFANLISDFQYLFSFRDRRSVYNNIKSLHLSNINMQESTREVFRNFGRYLVEFFSMHKILDRQFIEKNVKFHNLERLEAVVKRGKGALILTGHIGNWELGAAVLSRLGFSVFAVALPHNEKFVNNLFNHQREKQGITVIPTNIAVRKCIEALKENKLVAIVGDRDFHYNGTKMNFLAKEAVIPRGAALFAEKTGAAILPTFLVRKTGNTFNMFFEEPIFPSEVRDKTVPKEHALTQLMKKYVSVIEEKIRQYPSQWLMFREYWIQ